MNFIKVSALACDENGKTIMPVHEIEFFLNVDLILIIQEGGDIITKESNNHKSALQLTIGKRFYNSITMMQALDNNAVSI